MPRNRNKRKSTKHNQPSIQAPSPAHRKLQKVISPSSASVIERIANYEGSYIEDNFARILIESYELADEPDFADLTFPSEKTLQATQQVMDKYDDRLEEIEQEADDEEQPELVDEIRIEIIQRIATPFIRKEVTQRLERMVDRLMAGDDPERFEVAMVLSQIMKLKELPWGIVGLILAIYQRTMDQEFEDLEAAEELLGEVLAEMQEGRDPVDVLQEGRFREKGERFIKKLEEDRDFWDKIDREADESLEKFEKAILTREVDLALFSAEELDLTLRPLEKVRDYPEDAPAELVEEPPLNRMMIVARLMLIELLTPERLKEIKVELSRLSSKWLREGNPWAPNLMQGLLELDELPVEDQRFLLIVYIRQLLDVVDEDDAQE